MAYGIATRESQAVAGEIQDLLEDRDVQGLGFMALVGASGVIVAQEVAERVLQFLNMPRDPTTATQFAASGAIKLGYALAVGALAAAMGLSGLGLAALAFHAMGAVVFAGADLWNAVQRSGLLGGIATENAARAPVGGGSGNPRQPSQPRAGSPAAAGGGASLDGLFG